MVSLRCKLIVRDILHKLGLKYIIVNLGEVEMLEDITEEQKTILNKALLVTGLELMQDKRAMLIEQIKLIIVELIHYTDELPLLNFSAYLSEKLDYDYTYLSNLFSETEGSTIEHFMILHKIERVKELIIYNEHNLTEIAYMMHYSSVAHLSHQFKKVTGLTPTYFKGLKHKKRSLLENL